MSFRAATGTVIHESSFAVCGDDTLPERYEHTMFRLGRMTMTSYQVRVQ
jgi:hypothetical protein